MSDLVTGAAALTAATVYIARTAYELVLKSKNGASEEHKRCEADRVATTLQASLDIQNETLREIKVSQQDTRDGVRELVTLSRTHRE